VGTLGAAEESLPLLVLLVPLVPPALSPLVLLVPKAALVLPLVLVVVVVAMVPLVLVAPVVLLLASPIVGHRCDEPFLLTLLSFLSVREQPGLLRFFLPCG
jgi:hypothetical protein